MKKNLFIASLIVLSSQPYTYSKTTQPRPDSHLTLGPKEIVGLAQMWANGGPDVGQEGRVGQCVMVGQHP